jgi:hypothetical protein
VFLDPLADQSGPERQATESVNPLEPVELIILIDRQLREAHIRQLQLLALAGRAERVTEGGSPGEPSLACDTCASRLMRLLGTPMSFAARLRRLLRTDVRTARIV